MSIIYRIDMSYLPILLLILNIICVIKITNIVIPFISLAPLFQLLYIPGTIDYEVKELISRSHFKNVINWNSTKVPDYFDYGDRKVDTIHRRHGHNSCGINADLCKIKLI